MTDTLNASPDQEERSAPPDPRAGLRDLLGAALLLAVSLAFAAAALRIPFRAQDWVWYSSPGIFALAMAACLGACSLVVVARGWRVSRAPARRASASWPTVLREWGIARFLAGVAAIVAYLVALGHIPFLLASSALILVFGTAFREEHRLRGVVPSLIAAAIVMGFSVLITKVFGIVLP